MNKKSIFKILVIFFAIQTFAFHIMISHANYTITEAELKDGGDCGQLIMYKGSVVKTTYISYTKDGIEYPAYCLEREKPGAEAGEYTVNVDSILNNNEVWRVIINGYPYKSLAELGVANKHEAFTATKQAVYYVLEGRSISDISYIVGNEASIRTYNALIKIIENANNSSLTKQSADIRIQKETTSFAVDSIDKTLVSMTYSVIANATIDNYQISLSGELPEGIQITDLNGNIKASFSTGEKFKICIPVNKLLKDGDFTIKVTGEVKTKPVFYGKSPDSAKQDYALTASELEQGDGSLLSNYIKNLTKIIILKQDQDSKEALPETEFSLLNEQKEVIYESLITNNDGEIILENLIPGKYYLQEVQAAKGYTLFPELIDLEIRTK